MPDTVEITALAISAPHFYCGVVLHDDKVTQAAPIVRKWAMGKTSEQVRQYCRARGWRCVDCK
jgi:hypothetical protein